LGELLKPLYLLLNANLAGGYWNFGPWFFSDIGRGFQLGQGLFIQENKALFNGHWILDNMFYKATVFSKGYWKKVKLTDTGFFVGLFLGIGYWNYLLTLVFRILDINQLLRQK
jgi:hypothetical protein